MKLSDRMDSLEKAIITHLEESGEIRSDLKWLKKSFYVLGGLIVSAIVERFFRG